MGFFSNIFKKKKGGTFAGNLIRGVVSNATGGILGNGSQLRAWEAEQEQKKFDNLTDQIQSLKQQNAQSAHSIGANAVMSAKQKAGLATEEEENKVLGFLKKYWYWFTGGAAALIGGIWYFVNRKSNNKFKRLK